jgi:dihydroflavonol-4-reductase
MQVFMTGGTGFIGQALARTVLRRGWRLQVLVRDPDAAPARWLAGQGATLVPGDVTADGPWMQAMRGAGLVLHNAGVYEIGADRATAQRMQAVNAGGTERVLAAAHQAGVPKVLYVSTVWALGGSGRVPAASLPRDERHTHDGFYPHPYARSKHDAHRVALQWRERGLPLVTVMPNAVVGANDHAVFGYLLRLQLLGAMSPFGFGGDAVLAPVDVGALAEGMALAAERGPAGADYLLCGPAEPMRPMLARWTRLTGRPGIRFNLPRGLMRPQMALVEPLLRRLGLPAFLSREAVDTTRCHLHYVSTRAHRELGWTHPDAESMWSSIIEAERRRMAGLTGWREKLRHQPLSGL